MAILQSNVRKYIDVKNDLNNIFKMNKFGSRMTVNDFDKLINNSMPPNPSCLDCRDQNTARLKYTVRYRDDLLKQGKYFKQDKGVFITVPQKENIVHIKGYARKARNAANRGMTLNHTTPVKVNKHQVTNDTHFNEAIKHLNQVK